MSHTMHPWSSRYKMSKIFGQVDNAELAARLWSPNAYDRRGNVVFMDGFETNKAAWEEIGFHATASASISTNRKFTGASSLKYTSPAINGDSGSIQKYFPLFYDTNIGFEASFNSDDTNLRIELYIRCYDGTNYSQGTLRWEKGNNTLEYRITGGSFVELANNLWHSNQETSWVPMKISIDHENRKYIRARFADQDFDLSTISTQTNANVTRPNVIVAMIITPLENVVKKVYIDHVIITQNED